jgi:predicted transposase YdaD
MAWEIDRIGDRQVQSKLVAVTSILAGLKLDKKLIQLILRKDLMRESVIYQDILQEGLREGRRAFARKLLALNMDFAQIVELVELPKAEVRKIQQELSLE